MVLAIIWKANTTKGKANKGDYIKLKSSMQQRGKNQQNEKAIYGMEKVFANNISDKELISKIYKKLMNLLVIICLEIFYSILCLIF